MVAAVALLHDLVLGVGAAPGCDVRAVLFLRICVRMDERVCFLKFSQGAGTDALVVIYIEYIYRYTYIYINAYLELRQRHGALQQILQHLLAVHALLLFFGLRVDGGGGCQWRCV